MDIYRSWSKISCSTCTVASDDTYLCTVWCLLEWKSEKENFDFFSAKILTMLSEKPSIYIVDFLNLFGFFTQFWAAQKMYIVGSFNL